VPTAGTAGWKAGHFSAGARLTRSGRGHRPGHALRLPQARRGPKRPACRWRALCPRRAGRWPSLRLRDGFLWGRGSRPGGGTQCISLSARNGKPPFRRVRMIFLSGKRLGCVLGTLPMRRQRPVSAGGTSTARNGLRAACSSTKPVGLPASIRNRRMGCCGAGERCSLWVASGRSADASSRTFCPATPGHGRRDTQHPRAMPPRHGPPGTIGCGTAQKDAGGFPGRRGVSAGRRPRMFLCLPLPARR
jgi:hypothetical protein